MKNKVILIIMDGWGHSEETRGNAVKAAHKPNFEHLWKKFPHAFLKTDGESVGLPEGQMGTSEVNHMTIGAGRVVFQDLVKINKAIREETIGENETILKAFEHVKKHDSVLHITGLLSDGGVHSHQEHFYALLALAKRIGIHKVMVHAILDGRDTPPRSAKKYITELEDFMMKLGIGRIASIGGRYYAMDRDENWDRVDLAYNAMVRGEGQTFSSALEALEAAYEHGESDEHIIPAVIHTGTAETQEEAEQQTRGEAGTVGSNDAMILVNFRADRGIQISKKFTESPDIQNLHYATMTHYRDDLNVNVIFPPETVENNFSDVLASAGFKQLRLTETEKFNHVTFFFNSKRDKASEGEDRFMFDSNSDVKTHDEKPEMRAHDITRHLVSQIKEETYDFILVNFPNPDMVGHTANFPAVVKAVETIDECIGVVSEEALKHGYDVLITADHGNAEELIDLQTGEPKTSHTLNLVPFILVTNKELAFKKESGFLTDLAPTMLDLLELPIPQEMTGASFV